MYYYLEIPLLFFGPQPWTSVELVGISNSGTLNKSIRDDVADLVDDFINNFLAENQK